MHSSNSENSSGPQGTDGETPMKRGDEGQHGEGAVPSFPQESFRQPSAPPEVSPHAQHLNLEKMPRAENALKVATPETPASRVYIGMQLHRWVIVSRIGAGSFGETFSAIDISHCPNPSDRLESGASQEEIERWYQRLPPPSERKEMCIKVEQENKNVLRLEVLALKRVQTCSQVVRYLGSGRTNGIHFLVMEKLGPNLAELRRRTAHGSFNIYTTLKAGISCLRAIREVHERGLIHRDIKPSNFITGLPGTPEFNVCYLIDFGLARRYRRSSGELREARAHAGFRGTSRYASVASHQHKELGRVDDLWSLLFMIVEFATGSLPWRKCKVKEDIGAFKEKSLTPRLIRSLPREFLMFFSHLEELKYEDEPNYDMLLGCMHRALDRRGYPPDKPLDWEVEPTPTPSSSPAIPEADSLVLQAPSCPGRASAGVVRVSEIQISCPPDNNAESEEVLQTNPSKVHAAVEHPTKGLLTRANALQELKSVFSPQDKNVELDGPSPSLPNHAVEPQLPLNSLAFKPGQASKGSKGFEELNFEQEVELEAVPPDNAGTTSIPLPPPSAARPSPKRKPPPRKAKSSCNCLVM